MINQVDLTKLEPAWDRAYTNNFLHVPFLNYQWHVNWKKILGTSYEQHYLEIDGDIIAPFVSQDKTIYFSGGEEGADYLDIVGPADKKKSAWDGIMPYLKSNHMTQLILRNIPEGSPTIDFFKNLRPAIIEKEDTTPTMQLPATWEAYIKSLDRKDRHELERKMRKFEREHIDAVVEESDNPGRDIEILLYLMKKDEDKQAFLRPEMERFFKTTAITFADSISLLFVSIGDKKIAATLSFIVDNVLYLYNSGFDKECCANAGFYLKAASVKRATEHGLKSYNFLQGDERYKYELGGKDFFVYKITCEL